MDRFRRIAGCLSLATLLCSPTPVHAVQLRVYSASRHDRFTGFPDAPVWNDAAWFDSRAFAGVGWCPTDSGNKRQFALVSPQHVVFARHFDPHTVTTIRFLGTSGVVVNRTISNWTAITNDLDQDTDLVLMRFTQPLLASDRVPHFPYLDLADENAYLNASLTIFGWHAKAGRGHIAAFGDIEEPGFVNLTRSFNFNYEKNAGFQDDCYLVGHDSGSPSFATVNGRPALVGFHTAVGEDALYRYNHDTFVPHYVDKLNLLMAPDGYQMTPTAAPPAALAASADHSPVPWRQAMPATCRFDLTNTSAAPATNAHVILRFPAAQAPLSLDAPGWISAAGEPGEFLLHRATFAAGETHSLTASWTSTGTSDRVTIRLEQWADGIAAQSHDFSANLAPSYQAWAAGLAQPLPGADGDGDGFSNLLEYAFGGDPAVCSRFQPGGVPLQPQPAASGIQMAVSFPVRDDADVRGLTYVVEFSTTLGEGSWSADPPPGHTVDDDLYSPDSPGFLKRTVTFDANTPRRFCRVRVELDEES